MARALTPQDAYSIINLMAKEVTGQDATVQAVDTSSFVSVGETILSYGTENVLNALGIVLGRTFMAVRPYDGKFDVINMTNTGLFGTRMRKISFYSKEAQASGYFNTDLYTNLNQGYDNGSNQGQSVGTMWEQNQAIPLELNFAGQSVWDDSITVYEKQLQVAFRNEADFISFVTGAMTERRNDIETQKESFKRMAVLNYMGGLVDLNNATSLKNLTAGYNAKFGTTYTTAQLKTTYLQEFLQYFVAEFKLASKRLTNRSAKCHWSPAKSVGGVNYTLLRHTPMAKQKALLYSPLFVDAEAQVFSQIFNPEYLDIKNFEPVEFWQNENEPSKIKVTPAIPDTTNPTAQKAGAEVALDMVVGLLFDEDALMIDFQLEDTYTTPVEARKGYRNIWWHFSYNIINDFTENAILFYMAD